MNVENSFGQVPKWENVTNTEATFTEKATPVDPRTKEEFEADWELHKEIREQVKSTEPTNWSKIVENFPTEVPESSMTQEERDEHLGAHPMTRHELDLEK